jgi:hypothetical protein
MEGNCPAYDRFVHEGSGPACICQRLLWPVGSFIREPPPTVSQSGS